MPANLINIQENGVDLSDQYVGAGDLSLIDNSYLKDDYKRALYGAGWGFYGAQGGSSDLSVPTLISTTGTFKKIEGSVYSSYGIKYNNTLWSWGGNIAGQLGLGHTSTVNTPAQVGTLSNWSDIAGTQRSAAAIKTDGTLWVWGANDYGQLGLNQSVSTLYSSPVQVGSLTNWKSIFGSNASFMAIKTDGTLWAWGRNDRGILGVGDLSDRSSPVQVGSGYAYVSLRGYNHTAAVKTDGTLWTWGWNGYGALGFNDKVHRTNPTQVGSLTNWKQVSAGNGTVAVKTDGTLWSWGNDYLNYTSSPVQVGTMTNWKEVTDSGSMHMIALKTDGTVWSWGQNNYGELGLGDTTARYSPVQVGSKTNWKLAIACGDHSLFAE